MKKEPRIGIPPFTEVLLGIAGGDLEKQLTTELSDVTRAVEATGGNGTIEIKLTIRKDGKMLVIKADTKVKTPKPSVEATSFFMDDRGGLHTENPRQTQMFDGPKSVTPIKPDGEN